MKQRMILGSLLSVLSLLAAWSLAISFKVEPEDDEVFSEAIARAFSTWQAVEGSQIDLTQQAGENAETPTTIFRNSTSDAFGPDILAISSVERQNDQSRFVVEVKAGIDDLDRVLLHETAMSVDLRSASEGVLDPRVESGETASLSPSDERSLSELYSYAQEDLNKDGVVDFYDLGEFASFFNREGSRIAADFNNDFVVNQEDLDRLIAQYQFSPPQAEKNSSVVNEEPDIEDLPDGLPQPVEESALDEVAPESEEGLEETPDETPEESSGTSEDGSQEEPTKGNTQEETKAETTP